MKIPKAGPKSTIPYGRQTISLGDRLAVFRSLGGRNLTQGPKVQEFEEKFADFCGSKFAIAFSSGTAALHASAFVTKVAHNSPTYTSGLTFVATANAIVHAGGKVQLLDIDPTSWNINLGSVPPGASSLFTVDFAGLPTNLPGVEWEPGQKPPVIVEDCAHSLGGSTPEGRVGNGRSATVSCFSLHPVKGMTTGEGGMATTNDPAIAEALKKFRSHGISQNVSTYSWEYDAEYPGLNYRMTDFQASLGISQLRRLPKFIDLRNEIADRYRQLLGETSLTLPPSAQAGYRHAYHLFPVLFETSARRENAFYELRRQGIIVQVHYRPVHMHTAHKELAKDLPTNSHTEDIASRILSIPIFPGLKQHQQMRVVKALKGLL